MSMNDRFLAMQICSHDEHDGEERPNAVIVRLTPELQARIERTVAFMQRERLLNSAVTLDDADVRFIKTVGFNTENGISRVPGDAPGQPDWMPVDADVTFPSQDITELDMDDPEVADYREDCVVFQHPEWAMEGVSHLSFSVRDDQYELDPDGQLHVSVIGRNRSSNVSSFVHKAGLFWPQFGEGEEEPRRAERMRA